MDDKEMLHEILKAIGQLGHDIKQLDNKIDTLTAAEKEHYEHLLGIVASQGLDLESMSSDIRYLVQREADNRHRMTILSKSINLPHK